ncbi:YbaY family lipoprotein [Pseudoxanthomonas sp. UTMC 1351]|uniref:YbaY family lipoprotein n=1 Tax=Pseudoxanthomonas sp. UTMC 1351 TaxID=2695853 RepID=UPI0034CFB16D
MRSGILLMAGVIAMAGCQSNQSDTPKPAEPDAPPAIQGHAIYRERIAAPPGATLTVQLIDNQLADTPEAVIAMTQVYDAKGPPFAFALPFDAGKLRENGSYGLHASLRDAEGTLWFVTDTPTPVVPASGDPVELRMVRASSPWDDAKSRGIGFRGIGTEPGWLVEVGRGESPSLHAELDYGERKIDVARTEVLTDGFRGKSADGLAVSLKIVKETCSDGMSDVVYPASMTLTISDQTYRGCGRFLFD